MCVIYFKERTTPSNKRSTKDLFGSNTDSVDFRVFGWDVCTVVMNYTCVRTSVREAFTKIPMTIGETKKMSNTSFFRYYEINIYGIFMK